MVGDNQLLLGYYKTAQIEYSVIITHLFLLLTSEKVLGDISNWSHRLTIFPQVIWRVHKKKTSKTVTAWLTLRPTGRTDSIRSWWWLYVSSSPCRHLNRSQRRSVRVVTARRMCGATPRLIKFEIIEMITGAATQAASLPPIHCCGSINIRILTLTGHRCVFKQEKTRQFVDDYRNK